ncbi:MAG: glycosyltransferase [Chloroflexota bacterium]|nr:MAG: glycosyltransferase [Chloroflexota bacterium]
MKIAYLGIKGLPSKSGAERVVEAIVRRMALRHEVIVYCNARYTHPDAHMDGMRLIRIPTLPGKHFQALSLFVFSALHALFRGNYDLVHVHNTEACFVVPLLRSKYRIIATSHGQAYRRDKWGSAAKKLIQLIDNAYAWFPHMLTSVSKPLADEYAQRFGKVVHYLPNGVESYPIVDAQSAERTLRENGVVDSYVLFAAGRVDPTKGCHLLLEAFGGLDVDLQLTVVGDLSTLPAYSRELQRMADPRVRFVPFVKQQAELFGIVQRARLFVFPSTVEAMSMMLLEVASLGVPIVCSDIPENTGALGEHALYFRSGDSEDLANKLQWALDHRDDMQNRAMRAQQWVRQNLNWDVLAEEYDRLYELLITGACEARQPSS